MTRTLVSDFALENPIYSGALLSIFQVDANLARTATLAPLYAAQTGAALLANPQQLTSRGANAAPIFVDRPVVVVVQRGATEEETGVQGLAPRWRGNWTPATLYYVGERVRDPGGASTYVVLTSHTSSGILASDVAANRLALEIDGAAVSAGAVLNVFPPAPGRNNRLLGFDPAGNPVTYARDVTDLNVTPAGHTTPRTLNFITGRRANPLYFGGVGNGTADDLAALAASAALATSAGIPWEIPDGIWRFTDTLTIGGAFPAIECRGLLRYAGPNGRAALVIGDGGTARNANRRIEGLRVERATFSDWTNEADIGVVMRNFDACRAEILQAEGFTIGIRTLGDGRGFEDSSIFLGRIANNRIGLDIRTTLITGWNNAVRYYGGHFANASGTNPSLDRYGVRFSREANGYQLHNHHVFYGPAFELQNQAGAVLAIPCLTEVNSRAVVMHAMRVEGNSPQIHRQTAGAQDHVYEVAFSSNGAITGEEGNAYLLESSYPAGASRAGATIIPLHQAAAAVHANKLIAGVPTMRAAMFRDTSTQNGIEGMAVMVPSPAGGLTSLNQLALRSTDDLAPVGDDLEFTARGIGFVVATDVCKEFLLGFDGVGLRVMVALFDISEQVQNSDSIVPLASNAGLQRVDGSRFWRGGAVAQDSSYTRLQRITVPASTAFAVIGVTHVVDVPNGNLIGRLRAIRLFTPGIHAPRVLAGGNRAWGSRELTGSAAWDPPSIAAGATATTNVTVTGARPGDFAEASFTQGTILPFSAQVSGSDTVTVRVWNPTGGPVDLSANTAFARVIKARV